MKKRQGMSLVEVVISFVILLVISVMVLNISSNYLKKFGVVKSEVTENAFEGQGTIEDEIEKISNYIAVRNEANEIQNDLTQAIHNPDTLPADKVVWEQELKERTEQLKEVGEKLKKLTKDSSWDACELKFGEHSISKKNCEAYQVTKASQKNLYVTGWVFAQPMAEKIPIIQSIICSVIHPESERYLYDFAKGKSLKAEIKYLPGFESEKQMHQVVWYQSLPGFHIYPYKWEQDGEISKDFVPVFPESYGYIREGADTAPSHTTESTAVTSSMEGSFLVCTARPYTKQGILGRMVASNPIYVSKLPFKKEDYLLMEDFSIMNPKAIVDTYGLSADSRFDLDKIYAWNNTLKEEGKVSMESLTESDHANYMIYRQDETGKIKMKDGSSYVTKSRSLNFDKKNGYKLALTKNPTNTGQFSVLLAVGKTENAMDSSGNIFCMTICEEYVEAHLDETDPAYKKLKETQKQWLKNNHPTMRIENFESCINVHFEGLTYYRPEREYQQTLTSPEGNLNAKYVVEQKKVNTEAFPEVLKESINSAKQGVIFSLVKDKDKIHFFVNGLERKWEDDFSMKFAYNVNSKMYLGNAALGLDESTFPAIKTNSDYESALMNVYEIMVLDQKDPKQILTNDENTSVTDMFLYKYGVQKAAN